VAFGDYTGGELKIHDGDASLQGEHNICRSPLVADFSKITHSVLPFEGERFSLVFYVNKGHHREKPVLPEPNVVLENGKYVFYRGDEKIDEKKGLPHPLRRCRQTENAS
jgi:hypothetical protein